MKLYLNRNWITPASLLLAIPTAYFIFISVLKYSFNINGPFNNSWPLLTRLGIQDSIGLNINLLILFGPVLAIFLNIFRVVSIDKRFTKEHFHFHIRIRKLWFPIIVIAISTTLLATLFVYLFLENCLVK